MGQTNVDERAFETKPISRLPNAAIAHNRTALPPAIENLYRREKNAGFHRVKPNFIGPWLAPNRID